MQTTETNNDHHEPKGEFVGEKRGSLEDGQESGIHGNARSLDARESCNFCLKGSISPISVQFF